MRRGQSMRVDDADMAAGRMYLQSSPPTGSSTASLASINTTSKNPVDLRFTDDATPGTNEAILVLGIDVSHLSRRGQFLTTASGVFWFSLLYGYLQELISVQLCHRQLGLFLAMVQFAGYTLLSYWLRNLVDRKQKRMRRAQSMRDIENGGGGAISTQSSSSSLQVTNSSAVSVATDSNEKNRNSAQTVPWKTYLFLSLLRAVDLGMTNLAMQYINYPAKTLMKSSRIVFTMLFGAYFGKKYFLADYLIVLAMVAGLALFMHADANSDAVFDYRGVIMLIISLLCDGAISNMSETIMSKYKVGQDEFIFRLYSIAFLAISAAAAIKGDLREGLSWMRVPGTYDQMNLPADVHREWSVSAKWLVLIVFSSMGFFGSSCSAAITKNFGALTMSITSTARKATTLFLSFFLFKNVCTSEHVFGIVIFIAALTTKSLRRGRKRNKRTGPKLRKSGNVRAQSHSSHNNNNGATDTTPRTRLVRRTNSSDGVPRQGGSASPSNGGSSSTNLARGIHVV